MKKKKNEIIRLQSIIESDRINASDNFIKLVIEDLTKLFREYFDFKDNLTLDINKSGENYMVQTTILATRIKNFVNIE